MSRFVGAIDQGTTSSRFMVFDVGGRVVGSAKQEHRQIFPKPGWVEHDPVEIWETTKAVIVAGLADAGISAADLVTVGLTNQRETTVVWNRATGQPVTNAIVWQDTRTDQIVHDLAGEQGIDRFRAKTGLPLATYFSGPKVTWILDNVGGVEFLAKAGDLAFGTIDSWILWNLTGGPVTGRHVTDVTNASRTMLMDLDSLAWDSELAAAMRIPEAMLPEIIPSVGRVAMGTGPLAGVPISGVLGDQQAALFGQACFDVGEVKNTYGTGCFLLMNTGTQKVPSTSGLLTTVGYQIGDEPPVYALEGSIAIAGALVQWLRDNLQLFEHASEIEALAASVPDNGDIYIVPAFSGLFAPHWRSDARGVIAGLTRFATKAHLARASLEATAFQTREVIDAMRADSGVELTTLKVDGGMVVNDLLMQFQSDILDVPVVRPTVNETTALGAAYAAGLSEGFWDGLDSVAANWGEDRRWTPDMDGDKRAMLLTSWGKAVKRTLDWID